MNETQTSPGAAQEEERAPASPAVRRAMETAEMLSAACGQIREVEEFDPLGVVWPLLWPLLDEEARELALRYLRRGVFTLRVGRGDCPYDRAELILWAQHCVEDQDASLRFDAGMLDRRFADLAWIEDRSIPEWFDPCPLPHATNVDISEAWERESNPQDFHSGTYRLEDAELLALLGVDNERLAQIMGEP